LLSGAIKSWTAFIIATNEIPANRHVGFDTTVEAMGLTAQGDGTRSTRQCLKAAWPSQWGSANGAAERCLIGATRMFGLAGGFAGQFVVGPMLAPAVALLLKETGPAVQPLARQ
jgi:hypothetical protein